MRLPKSLRAASFHLAQANSILESLLGQVGCLTLNEAARELGISKGSVSHAVRRGDLEGYRLLPTDGSSSVRLLITKESVEAFRPRAYPREGSRR